MIIRTPDHRLRVFISSTLKELAEERKAVRQAILKLHLAPVMFDGGARPHPAQELYRSYLLQSQIFIGIYWQSYGWIGPDMSISGLEDEYNLSAQMPRLIYIKSPAPNRDPELIAFLNHIRDDNTGCYTSFSTPAELEELVQNDLALLLTEHFEAVNSIQQPPVETLQHPPTNVPIPRNILIGRELELATARDLLLRDDVAMITLTGAGGTGKSRLALQIGLEMLDNFKDGVFLVRLEPISNPDLVISTIAETLGIRETTGSLPVSEMLIEFLRNKQMLLILDNFEQVVGVAPFIARLLETCPQVKSIVTSRVPLRLRAEKVIPIPTLTVPSMEKFTDLINLSHYAAVELFIQRAQAVKPDFTVTSTNAAAVAEICYRLDGLPLAIELAAARIKLLTPQELLSRLDNRFDLLRSGMRDLPERQRTLRGAIDWSYNLLGDQEKKLFRRLSIFIGGWTLEAAKTVCTGEDDLGISSDDTLASLLDNSLIIPLQETEEQTRFGMLATIHEYAYERLVESDEVDSMHIQHAQYYMNFVKIVEPLVRSSERVHWQKVMQQEFGNIRGVLEWITSTGNCTEIGQQIIMGIGILWVTSSYFLEGGKWCAKILSLSGESTPAAIRAALLDVAGLIAWAQGDYAAAQINLDESLALLNKLDINTLEAKNLLARTLIVRGMLASTTRDLEKASSMLQRSIELFAETKDQWYEAVALSWLGDIALYENKRDQAMELHDQSIKLAREQGDPWCLVPALMTTAQVTVLDGDQIKARSIFLEAVDLLHKTCDQWSLSFALNDLGHLSLMNRDLDQAGFYFLEGFTLAKTLGNLRVLLVSLAGAAAVIAMHSTVTGNDSQINVSELAFAARLCGATMPYVDKPGIFIWIDSKMLYEAAITQVRSLMDEELWNKNYAVGQSMSIDQAIALAIQSLKDFSVTQVTSIPNG